ncbi:DNA-directed RNA polymerase subunit H [Methanobrevibacter curvatus]|uniref:DNA-directed RNA polymerase subunit Rpo5 n=1 Tax=Methanobrevibacter curvatus TaxID=49547 RepID=A0A165ZAH7_9EURY|nr:DNA-directed RNA polymerase subunit H [Methanobrevibacter curvatus]KZX10471.1 DNA-directed RNA polymerase subunit H [Methanobrevibacter curvatus]
MSEGILVHELVPKHVILENSEIKKIFKDLDFHQDQLPKIKVEDPIAKAIGAEVGNVLEITRESETAGTFVTYRLVEP